MSNQLQGRELRQPNVIAFKVIISLLFFISGCSALLYQIIWQRMLFTFFGTDLTSITIIVSVFMFGLGMGALWGGQLADRHPTKLLFFYIGIELSIAIFGYLSPLIVSTLGNIIPSNEWITCTMSFLILIIPTWLMGSTFPILVMHINQYDENIGRVVGELYFANTLGGAAGAFLLGFCLLNFMTLLGVIQFAVFLNIFVVAMALCIFRRLK
jgi:predicted membrane-bound spermidine synthase